MKTITDKKEFDEIIATHDKVICFVHSPWALTSLKGLYKFKELVAKRPTQTFIIINNDSAESFIYKWLKDQEETFESRKVNLKKRTFSWIHGNGELLGIQNSNIIWFENSIYEQTIDKLETKTQF